MNKTNHNKKHGMWQTPTYNSWGCMIQRCYNVKYTDYHNYGGRGITVCDSWKESFLNFFNDMGERPIGTSLDRIDNNKGYSKDNCKWASRKEQARNMRKNNKLQTPWGFITMAEITEITGIRANTIKKRIKNNWDYDKLFNQPLKQFQRTKTKTT
jgi:hypothetical protein